MSVRFYKILYYICVTVVKFNKLLKLLVIRGCSCSYHTSALIIKPSSYTKIIMNSWYWTWGESAIFDFFISTILHRTLFILSLLFSFSSIVSFIEFSLYFRTNQVSLYLLNVYRLYGSKYILLMLVSVWMFCVSLAISIS